MAIVNFVPNDKSKVNVVMKNGKEYLGCDISSTNSDLVISFWYEGAVRVVPIKDIEYAEFYNEE